jgi:hypothetical protein
VPVLAVEQVAPWSVGDQTGAEYDAARTAAVIRGPDSAAGARRQIQHRIGKDRIGMDRNGSDRNGSEWIGSDWIGMDRIGSDWIGSDRIESDPDPDRPGG